MFDELLICVREQTNVSPTIQDKFLDTFPNQVVNHMIESGHILSDGTIVENNTLAGGGVMVHATMLRLAKVNLYDFYKSGVIRYTINSSSGELNLEFLMNHALSALQIGVIRKSLPKFSILYLDVYESYERSISTAMEIDIDEVGERVTMNVLSSIRQGRIPNAYVV